MLDQISRTESKLARSPAGCIVTAAAPIASSRQTSARAIQRSVGDRGIGPAPSQIPFQDVAVARVDERYGQQDPAQHDERKDAIDRLDIAQVDDENLEEADRQQAEAAQAKHALRQ